jgi:hypothetical protein
VDVDLEMLDVFLSLMQFILLASEQVFLDLELARSLLDLDGQVLGVPANPVNLTQDHSRTRHLSTSDGYKSMSDNFIIVRIRSRGRGACRFRGIQEEVTLRKWLLDPDKNFEERQL